MKRARPGTDLSSMLRGQRLHEPPRDVLAHAVSLSRALPRKKSLLDTVVELMFDSARSPLPAGVRGRPTERRLLYQAIAGGAEPRQLDLRVRREAGGTIELTGQCVPGFDSAKVEVEAGRTKRKASMTEAGEFVVRGLPGRAAVLLLRVAPKGEPGFTVEDVPLLES